MYKVINKTIDLGDGRTIQIETGKLAKQADGAVVVKMGDTMLLATVVSANEAAANVYLYFADVKWNGRFRPCEIKTLRLNTATHEIKEVNLLEE